MSVHRTIDAKLYQRIWLDSSHPLYWENISKWNSSFRKSTNCVIGFSNLSSTHNCCKFCKSLFNLLNRPQPLMIFFFPIITAIITNSIFHSVFVCQDPPEKKRKKKPSVKMKIYAPNIIGSFHFPWKGQQKIGTFVLMFIIFSDSVELLLYNFYFQMWEFKVFFFMGRYPVSHPNLKFTFHSWILIVTQSGICIFSFFKTLVEILDTFFTLQPKLASSIFFAMHEFGFNLEKTYWPLY